MVDIITAKEAYDLATQNYAEQVEVMHLKFMSAIEERAKAGKFYYDVTYVPKENKEKLEELGYKVVQLDTFTRIAWYDIKEDEDTGDDNTDPTDPDPTDPSDPSDPSDPDPSDP